jgi:hypothetical protein
MTRRSDAAAEATAAEMPSLASENPLLRMRPTLAEMHTIGAMDRDAGGAVPAYLQPHIARMEYEAKERAKFPIAERAAEILRRMREGGDLPLPANWRKGGE